MTARRSLRRVADGYDGPQILTTSRRWLRQPADRYDSSQILTTGRRWLRQPADRYDGPQIVTTAHSILTKGLGAPPLWVGSPVRLLNSPVRCSTVSSSWREAFRSPIWSRRCSAGAS